MFKATFNNPKTIYYDKIAQTFTPKDYFLFLKLFNDILQRRMQKLF